MKMDCRGNPFFDLSFMREKLIIIYLDINIFRSLHNIYYRKLKIGLKIMSHITSKLYVLRQNQFFEF